MLLADLLMLKRLVLALFGFNFSLDYSLLCSGAIFAGAKKVRMVIFYNK
jgi:hypothetical protein